MLFPPHFLKGSAAAAAVLSSPLLPADAASSETENGLFPPVSALCQTRYGPVKGREAKTACSAGTASPTVPRPRAKAAGQRRRSPPAGTQCGTAPARSGGLPVHHFPSRHRGLPDTGHLFFRRGQKRPVLVYLHGSAATGSSLELPGSELVRDAGCVFVALNYRLGLFGWNCLPTSLPTRTHQKLCLLDIARALDWVRDNIRRFGGDADNITLCGFSDGGRMAAALAGSPLFRGRFQKPSPSPAIKSQRSAPIRRWKHGRESIPRLSIWGTHRRSRL